MMTSRVYSYAGYLLGFYPEASIAYSFVNQLMLVPNLSIINTSTFTVLLFLFSVTFIKFSFSVPDPLNFTGVPLAS